MPSQNPKEYVASGAFNSLQLPAFPDLSELEKAIVGFVIDSSVTSTKKETVGVEIQHTAYNDDIKQVIFEYLKIENKGLLRRFIDADLRMLESIDSSRWKHEYKRAHTIARDAYKALVAKDVSEIEYHEIESTEFKMVMAIRTGPTAFRNYYRPHLSKLTSLSVLTSQRQGRKGKMVAAYYTALNPSIEYTK